jgi:hypothetical protein
MSLRSSRILLALAATLAPTLALAGNWATSPGSVGATAGATTSSLAITFTGDGQSSVIAVEYDYDEARFTPNLTPVGNATCAMTTAANRTLRVTAMSAGAPFPTTAVTLCNATFAVSPNAPPTTYPVNASLATCNNSQGLPQACTASPFNIVVGAPRTSPTVTYSPVPGNLAFPPGAPGTTGRATIGVDGSGGTVNESVNISQCVVVGTGLALVGSPNITIAANDPAGDLDGTIDVSCTYAAGAQTGSVNCNETPTVGTVTNRRWSLTCPAAVVGAPVIGALSASNVMATSARLMATISTNNAATTVTYEFKTNAAANFVTAGSTNLAASGAPSTAFIDLTGLVCETDYLFRVSAQNANGSVGPSAPASFRTGTCAATGLQVTLNSSGLLRAGSAVTLRATVTGASGTPTYHFDVDNDGIIDSSGPQDFVDVRYPGQYNGIVAVTVMDAAGSRRVERPLNIDAPRLLASLSGAPSQGCGDGDASPEPGERWNVPVEIVNAGGVATDDAHAIFVDHERLVAAGAGNPIDGGLRVETPAVAVGDLDPGASVQRVVTVKIAENTACGTSHRLRFFGSNDILSNAAGSDSPIVTFGLPAQCQVFNGCPATATTSTKAAVVPRQGLYFDPDRSGNGISNFVIERAGQSPVFFGAWFTGANDRKPTWYVIQGNVVENQVVAPVLRFSQNVAAPTFTVSNVVAGNAVVDLTQPEKLTLSYELSGRFGSEQMTYFTPGPEAAPDRSGAWYSVGEGGWGQIVHQYVTGGVQQTFVVHYVYDAVGQPRWVLAQGATDDLKAATPHMTFSAHCPGCPWIAGLSNPAGSGSIDLMTATTGKTSTAFVMPLLFGGTWNRTNLDIVILTTPQ